MKESIIRTPMTTEHFITEVRPDQIKQLGPLDLVLLTTCLLHNEAARIGIDRPTINAPEQITIPDGGRDILWKNDIAAGNFYIPKPNTIFQCKATKITESTVVKELSDKKKKIKPRIQEILEEKGALIFVTTEPWVKSSKKKDIRPIVESALKKLSIELHDEVAIGILDCNDLAKWTNNFPAAIAFVQNVTLNLGGVHFMHFQQWDESQHLGGSYESTPQLNSISAKIREQLITKKGVALRITGLSGLGKTRMALEAIRQRPDEPPNNLSKSTVYVQYPDNESVATNLILRLASNDYSGIVVLDDCPNDTHIRLRKGTANKNLSIVTLYNEPEKPDGKQTFTIKPEDNGDVVLRILKKHPKADALGEQAIERISRFSQGFPVVAKLLLDLDRVPTVDELIREEDMAAKLLGKGGTRDETMERVYSAFSLFSYIGGDKESLEGNQAFVKSLFLSTLAQHDISDHTSKLKKRGLLQSVANVIKAVPRPVAVAFAAEFIKEIDIQTWRNRIDRIEEAGLLNEFTSRLEEIEYSDHAQEIGELLIERGLPFTEAEYLFTGKGSQVFRSLTVLSPKTALSILEKVHASSPNIDVSSRDIVEAVLIIAWETELCVRALRVLAWLAVQGSEVESSHASVSFKTLFHLALSGTRLRASDRLIVIEELLESTSVKSRLLAIEALGEGLESGNFTRMSNTTLAGKRDARQDWYPETIQEQLQYWESCFRLLAKVALEDEVKAAEVAFDMLARKIDTIARTPLIIKLTSLFEQVIVKKNNLWPEAKDHLRNFKLYHGKTLTTQHLEALENWIAKLSPEASDLKSRLIDTVCRPGWLHEEQENGHFADIGEIEALRFAEEIIQNNIPLVEHARILLIGDQRQTFQFSKRLASDYSLLPELLSETFAVWPDVPESERNVQFFRGISAGLSRADRTLYLDKIHSSEGLRDILVRVICSATVSEDDLKLATSAARDGIVPIQDLSFLAYGSVLTDLPAQVVLRELSLLLSDIPEAAVYLLEIARMYVHKHRGSFFELVPLFQRLTLSPYLKVAEDKPGHHWSEVCTRLIRTDLSSTQDWAVSLAKQIIEVVREKSGYIHGGYLEQITGQLLAHLPSVIWPIFSDEISKHEEPFFYYLVRFLTRSGSRFDDSGVPIWELGGEQFRAWLRTNPRLIDMVVGNMHLYRPIQEDTSKEAVQTADLTLLPDDPNKPTRLEWHPHALILLEEGIESQDLRSSLVSNLRSFGSTGSRVPYLKERIHLLEQLMDTTDPRLQRIAEDASEEMRKSIAIEEEEELNREAKYGML